MTSPTSLEEVGARVRFLIDGARHVEQRTSHFFFCVWYIIVALEGLYCIEKVVVDVAVE